MAFLPFEKLLVFDHTFKRRTSKSQAVVVAHTRYLRMDIHMKLIRFIFLTPLPQGNITRAPSVARQKHTVSLFAASRLTRQHQPHTLS